jgi:FtsZ-binding cell division protein ZapB
MKLNELELENDKLRKENSDLKERLQSVLNRSL